MLKLFLVGSDHGLPPHTQVIEDNTMNDKVDPPIDNMYFYEQVNYPISSSRKFHLLL